ncbi:alpha/beta hydrolase [Ammoniphilus sp. CFH 90114]|nr:alpha/beta hydrolase [Ammoniphilus sp. CFH 90114]
MPHVLINRTPIYYEQSGHGPEHIVFIHGLGLSHTNWLEQVPCFQDRSRILTYDLRGHGRSGISPQPIDYSHYIEELANDLKGLLDHLNIDKTFLVGYSTGSIIAMQFMYQYPEMVRGAAVAGAFPKVGNAYLYTKLIGSFCLGKIHMKNWLSKQVARANGATREHIHLFEHEARKARIKETDLMIKGCLYFDITNKLNKICAPILLIYGGNERHMMKYRHQLLTSLPQGEVCLIPKINHACPTKGKEAFNKLIEDFIAEHSPTGERLTALNTNENTSDTEQNPNNFTKRNFVSNPYETDRGSSNHNQWPH